LGNLPAADTYVPRLEGSVFVSGARPSARRYRPKFNSKSVISAPNSTIVVGTNVLIGGLLKVIVHRPG
jgi:hypothetical protein